MKRLLFATASLCIAAAAVASPAAAFAAQPEPAYPDIYGANLEFATLKDFAIGDNCAAYTDGNTIFYIENEDKTEYAVSGKTFSALDCADGKFYYTLTGDNTVYSLPDKQPADYVMPNFSEPVEVSPNYYYYYTTETQVLMFLDKSKTEDSAVALEGCTRIKKYNDTLYVIKDNSLKTLDGAETADYPVVYSNYGMLERIPLGDAPEKLNTYSTFGQAPKIVNIADGATATKIDPNKIDAAKGMFPIESIDEARANTTWLTEGPALLLCETGSVRLIARGGDCYILDAADATDFTQVPLTPASEGSTATVNADEYAHSLPYMSNATRALKLRPSEVVDVLYFVSAEDVPVLAHDFYLIKNADGEYGYVAAEFLNDLSYPPIDEGGASQIPDPSPSDADNVRTVVLVLVVVALVLIAIGYMTWVITSKHRKVKKNADGEVDVTKEQKAEDEEKEE